MWGGSAPPNPPLLVGGKPAKPPKVKDWIHHTFWQVRKIVLVNESSVDVGDADLATPPNAAAERRRRATYEVVTLSVTGKSSPSDGLVAR